MDAPAKVEHEPTPRPRRKRGQFELRELLTVVTGVSILCSWIGWLPGLIAMVLLAWIAPAAVLIVGLIVVQWPLMLVTQKLIAGHRQRQRALRQAFHFPRRM